MKILTWIMLFKIFTPIFALLPAPLPCFRGCRSILSFLSILTITYGSTSLPFFLECILLFPFLSFDSRSIDSGIVFLKGKWDYHRYSEWVYHYCWIGNHIAGGYSRKIGGNKHRIANYGKSCRYHGCVDGYSKILICCYWRPGCTILEQLEMLMRLHVSIEVSWLNH